MLTRYSLTLKEQSKVKSDIVKRFAAHNFLKVDCTLQTSRTNNKWDRGKDKCNITRRFAAHHHQVS